MSNPPILSKAGLRRAESARATIPQVLAARGIDAGVFSAWLATQYAGLEILFAVLDVERIGKLESYTNPALVHQISTALGGLPVYVSNSSGLRYAVLLNKRPALPRRVDLPSADPGTALLGVRCTGAPAALPWGRLGHLVVAGMTGSGKSAFLRCLVYQAIRDGQRLLLGDVNRTTFSPLSDHPALLLPLAGDVQAVVALVERALGECEARAVLYERMRGYPESLEEYNALAPKSGADVLPRVLVIVDEASEVLAATGGSKGALGQALARLTWVGRKFGVTVVFATQEFTRDLVGAARGQAAAICFRLTPESAQMAARIGCRGAEKIPEGRPGLAITNRWGPIQAYFLDKALLGGGDAGPLKAALPDDQRALVERALGETGGEMSIRQLMGWGMSERTARTLLDAWERRGWVVRGQNRARVISQALRELVTAPAMGD